MSNPQEEAQKFVTEAVVSLLEFDFTPVGGNGSVFIANSKERLGGQIATLHNLAFYMWLVNEAREQILAGTFYDWKKQMVKQLGERL